MEKNKITCIDDILKNPYLCVSWYMICSFLYYKHDESILTDGEYDEICKIILKHYNTIEHTHKHLIDKDSLQAGSGYDIDVYPWRVRGAAIHALRQYNNGTLFESIKADKQVDVKQKTVQYDLF